MPEDIPNKPSYSSSDWLRRELDRMESTKADKGYVTSKVNSLTKETDTKADQLWSESELARLRDLIKINEGDVHYIRKRISRWDTWFKAAIVAILTGIVVAGGSMVTAVYNTQSLQAEMSELKAEIQIIKKMVHSNMNNGIM